MTKRDHPSFRALAAGLALTLIAALAACGPLISFGDGEPETVYTLHYEPKRTDEPTGPLVFVAEPSMVEGLGGRVIAVRLSDFERTLLKNVRWTTASSDLIREYLILSLRDHANLRTLGETGLDVSAKCRLNTTVQAMEFVPGATPEADAITFRAEMTLVSQVTGTQAAHMVFDKGRRVEGNARGIVAGFNAAMSELAAETGRWMTANIGACR